MAKPLNAKLCVYALDVSIGSTIQYVLARTLMSKQAAYEAQDADKETHKEADTTIYSAP